MRDQDVIKKDAYTRITIEKHTSFVLTGKGSNPTQIFKLYRKKKQVKGVRVSGLLYVGHLVAETRSAS